MKIRPTLTILSALAATAAVFAAAGLPADEAAAGPKTTTTSTTVAPGAVPTSAPSGDFVLPPGFVWLVDDTDRITVAVPSTWGDVNTSPTVYAGAEVPLIRAATNIEVWMDTFDAPGVEFAGFPYTPDPQTLINELGLTSVCASNTLEPYDDGVFTGQWAQWTNCGPTRAASWHLIVASPANQAFTAVVTVQLTGPQDQQALDVVLETFNFTATSTWPTSGAPTPGTSVPGTTTAGATTTLPVTTPLTTVPATTTPFPTTPTTAPPGTTAPVTTTPGTAVTTTPTTAAPPGPTTPTSIGTGQAPGTVLVDNTNLLTVTVPVEWTDQDTRNTRHDDGSRRATIAAAADLDQYYNTFDEPGTYLIALPPTTEPAALLGFWAYDPACTDGGTAPFDNGRFVGQQQTWTGCGGGQTRVVNVAARPLDNSFTIFVQVQVTTPDDTIVNQILDSFGVVTGGSFPQPVALAAPPNPTGPVPPELLSAPLPPDAMTLNDDEGRLSVAVPGGWTDTSTGRQMNDDGSPRPRISAAPDLDDYFTTWETPGTTVLAYPYNTEPAVILHNLGFADQCADGGFQTFDNGTFTGLMQTWTSCGNTDTRNVLLAVSPADQSVTLYIEVQLPDADNTPLATVLSSVRLT